MKVLDITYSDLDNFYDAVTEELFQGLSKDDLIAVVGIANSGIELSKGIFKRLQNCGYSNAHDYAVRCKRPHSSSTDLISGIYSKLPIPKWISNIFRTIEHHILGKLRPPQRTVEFLNHCETPIAKCNRILIIDDAVDSGHSMKAVHDKIKALNPRAKIDLVAFVITQKNPVICPSYYRHRDLIVRFPWAVDQ